MKQVVFLMTLVLFSNLGHSVAGFEPRIIPPLTERWRWDQQELLDGYYIWTGIEDRHGSLWFGASEGLLIYDGYTIERIPYPVEFADIKPYTLYWGGDDLLYVFTSDGLFTYDGDWERIIEFSFVHTSSRNLFVRNHSGLLLVGTPIGIYSLKGKEAQFEVSLEDVVSVMEVSGKGDLFIALAESNEVIRFPFTLAALRRPETWNHERASEEGAAGINLIRFGDDGDVIAVDFFEHSRARQFSYESMQWEVLNIADIQQGFRFSSGYGVDSDTLLIFTKTAIYVRHKDKWHVLSAEDNELPSNGAYYIHRRNGNLIIGGHGEPVWEIDLSDSRWLSYMGLHYQCDDLSGNSWFISVDSEIVEHDTRDDTWIVHDGNVISTPTSIICSADGTVWVSGSHQGVAAVSYLSNEEWKRDIHPELVSAVSHLSARQISTGDIWFGSGHEFDVAVGGLIAYSRNGDNYTYTHITQPYVPNRVVGIAEPEPGELWFGGYDLTSNKLPLETPYDTFQDLDVEWVDHITEGADGSVYVGTWQKGLLRREDGVWETVAGADKLASERIVYLLTDRFRENNIWVATNRGISRIDDDDFIPVALPPELRLQREGGTIKQSPDGAIWLNIASRDWYFRGYQTKRQEWDDPDYFRTIRYTPESDAPVIKIVHYDEGATEPANIIVRWEGIDRWSKTTRDQLRYSYRLDGADWSPFEVREELILMKLGGGEHQFEVRAKDLDGNISGNVEEAIITVLFPVWQRPWFILSGIAMVAMIIGLIVLLVRQHIRHLLQMENFKLQFFANISHEIRTPLTVIMGPLESALKRLPEGFDKTPIELAHRNSRKMLHLIDQILEFRRVEIGKLENHYVVSNVIKNIDETIQLLTPLAKGRNITLSTFYSHQDFTVRYDAEKVERILNNLISNAIKYSSENGSISVRISLSRITGTNYSLRIVVEDDGEGIREDKLKHIFDPFYRVQSGNQHRKVRGVGLGLSLVKSLVKALDGSINVESPAIVLGGQAKGTRFLVELSVESVGDTHADAGGDEPGGPTNEEELPAEDTIHDQDVLLVVEDEKEIRDFLTYEFNDEFEILTSEDGKDGFEKAKRYVPDLIITDILMPEMDGNELCEKVKAHSHTCHIPVIALTALKNEDHELKSLNRGADDFLNKPVSVSILRQKVRNLIHSRHQLRDMYQNNKHKTDHHKGALPSGSADDVFLNRFRKLVEDKMADPLFDIVTIATDLGMSRMTLYRKFKAITGDPPSQFVREIKMNRAAVLLKEGQLTVSEVADAVGFQELSNFSVAFKKYFGESPSQYQSVE